MTAAQTETRHDIHIAYTGGAVFRVWNVGVTLNDTSIVIHYLDGSWSLIPFANVLHIDQDIHEPDDEDDE